MALGIPLPDQVRRTQLVTVEDDLDVALDFTVGSYFACLLQPPKDADGNTEGPPRTMVPWKLFWESSQTLSAAGRVQLQSTGETFELTSRIRTIKVAETVMGYEAELMKLEELYPRRATLKESNDTQVATAMRCAIYQPSESTESRGDYENYSGEAPIEHEAQLQVKNRKLVLGSRVFRIVSAVANYELPHVSLELRRTAG